MPAPSLAAEESLGRRRRVFWTHQIRPVCRVDFNQVMEIFVIITLSLNFALKSTLETAKKTRRCSWPA